MKTIAALFETQAQAEQAIRALRTAGIRADDIGLIVRDARNPNSEDVTEGRTEGAGVGAIGGGVLGALGGLLLGASALVVPGIGPALAAGTIATTVAGGALGAAAGGLFGALIDAGLSEEDARHYQAGIERGAVLVTVTVADEQEAEVRQVFDTHGARDRAYHERLWAENPSHRYRSAQATALKAGPAAQWKEAEREGAILAGGATGGVLGTAAGALIAGPVGAAVGMAVGSVAGGATGAALDYEDAEPYFREDWEHGPHRHRFGWDDASAAYRYGWDSVAEPAFHGRSWREVRPDLERRWPGGAAWSDAEPLVRTAWDRRTRGSEPGAHVR